MGLWGVEANLRAGLISSNRFRLAVLGGFRFLRLKDEVQSGEQFQVASDVPGFGGSGVTSQDEFRTINDFYGGQIGAAAGAQFGPVMIDLRCKIALGKCNRSPTSMARRTCTTRTGRGPSSKGGYMLCGAISAVISATSWRSSRR